ncbi:MAG: DUF2938 domain-containing protein [candidate division Zixibacteria bacterium]|nr:DUF2938 domain-containing protein [candidate division Zixibacteria bacterium]
MVNLLEMILMGIFATFIMDLLAKFLVKSKIVRPRIEPHIPGRWVLYLLRGKFTHEDIRQTPAVKNEKPAALISHYLIGIVLMGIYLFLELKEPAIRDLLWMPLVFGVATVLLPWLWLYPSIGIGFWASKTKNQSDYIIFSSINHINFGIGMTIWVVVFRRFFT